MLSCSSMCHSISYIQHLPLSCVLSASQWLKFILLYFCHCATWVKNKSSTSATTPAKQSWQSINSEVKLDVVKRLQMTQVNVSKQPTMTQVNANSNRHCSPLHPYRIMYVNTPLNLCKYPEKDWLFLLILSLLIIYVIIL